jgi:hypothetical protein
LWLTQLPLSTEVVWKLWAKLGIKEIDFLKRSIFDLFDIGNGFVTPKN